MDVDTGLDDAIAIIMALHSPEIEIIGITTVSGNVTARAAALNTLGILRVMGKESKIPVLRGASRPLSKKIVHAEEVHGKKALEISHFNVIRLFYKKEMFTTLFLKH
jgi:purine nucleosidase